MRMRFYRSQSDTCLFFDGHDQLVEQFVDALIIELCGDSADNRQVTVFGIPQVVIALVLFPDIMKGVQCARFVEFIQYDNVRIIQHVDLFQL